MNFFKKRKEYKRVVKEIETYRDKAFVRNVEEKWKKQEDDWRKKLEEESKKKQEDDANVKYSLRESSDVKYSRKQSPNVRYSLDVDIGDDYHSWEKKTATYKSFSQMVIDRLEANNLIATDFYKKAQLDRKLFSKLKTDYCYQPTKATAIKICMGLDLDITEAEKFLGAAGYSLSKNLPFDLAIRYCFENSYTNVDDVNEVLYRLGEKTL